MRLNSQQPRPAEPPIIAHAARGPAPFSTVATMFYTIAVTGIMLYMTAGYWRSASRLETLWYPMDTANWVVTVNMLVYDGLKKFPETLREVCTVALIEPDDLPPVSAKILRETLEFVRTNDSQAGQVSAQLAVLLAETGSKSDAMRVVQSIRDTNAVDFQQAFRVIYGNGSREMGESPPNAFNYLGSSWSAWRFESRWHRLTAATWDAEWHDRWIDGRARQKATIVVLMSGVVVLIIVVGFGLLPWLLHCRSWKGSDESATDFSFREGFGIFVRAELLGWSFVVLCSVHPLGRVPMLAFGLATAAPFVAMLARRHWRHGHSSWASFVGLPERFGGWWPLLGAAVCVVAIDMAAGTLIHGGAVAIGQEGHWAEGLDETLIHDTWPNRFVMLANGILWAPLYEEFAFRGVLFPALRARVGVFLGALASSAIFASLHFYGLEGFLSVAVFGFVNALVFHYTHSLVPCIVAHIVTNLLVFGTDAALFV